MIRPNQSSSSSLIISVNKRDDMWRMCITYWTLNNVTILDQFPISVIKELLDELHGTLHFSKLDQKSGGHKVRVKEEDIHKTTFQNRRTTNVIPFGLTNSHSMFHSLVNNVFRSMWRKFVLVFL